MWDEHFVFISMLSGTEGETAPLPGSLWITALPALHNSEHHIFKANGDVWGLSCKRQYVIARTSGEGLTLALSNDWTKVISHRPEEHTHTERQKKKVRKRCHYIARQLHTPKGASSAHTRSLIGPGIRRVITATDSLSTQVAQWIKQTVSRQCLDRLLTKLSG